MQMTPGLFVVIMIPTLLYIILVVVVFLRRRSNKEYRAQIPSLGKNILQSFTQHSHLF